MTEPDGPNDYKNYIDAFYPDIETSKPNKVKYTLHIQRAVFTDEAFELYKRYELAVHHKDREAANFKRHLCNSPVYDPAHESETVGSRKAAESWHNLDEENQREVKDEGFLPQSQGSYMMMHRLDGKLVAIGCLDILTQNVDSAYFIYDPDFKFLNLGVIGALVEIEYMRKLRRLSEGKKFKWYVLGDLVHTCPKVNYKTQY